MTAIISGNSLGLNLTSLATLGQRGGFGVASGGRNGELSYVNVATGNLVLQDHDERLAGHGLAVDTVRTYNSLGLMRDDNGDNWSLGFYSQQLVLSGTVNTVGSTLTRTDRDGSQAIYAFDAGRATYVSAAGGGAYDTIRFDSANSQYVWTDGATRNEERYAQATGRLVSLKDSNGNTLTYAYDANGNVASVSDPSGGTNTYYDYSGTKLTQVRTLSGATTITRVHYAYDASNRLNSVTVDLSPTDGSVADGKSYSTSYTYDGTSTRVAGITQSDGTSLGITYVLVGSTYRVATLIDALGQVTTFSYDSANRRTTVTDPLGLVTAYDYDAAGQLTQVVEPSVGGAVPQATRFAYNPNGDLIQVTDAAGRVVQMAYDANGNPVLQSDSMGNTVTRVYDASNRLVSESVSTDGGWTASAGATLVDGMASKTGGATNTWDVGVRSNTSYAGGAAVSFTATQATAGFMVGLNSDPATNDSYASIDYALYCRGDGLISVYENGTQVGTTYGTYAAGDQFAVTYDGNRVLYLKNGVIFRAVAATISAPLFADSSFYTAGAAVNDLKFGPQQFLARNGIFYSSPTMTLSGKSATKSGGSDSAWDSEMFSTSIAPIGSAALNFTVSQANKALAVGLTTANPGTSGTGYAALDYAFMFGADGTLSAYEGGTLAQSLGTYVAGDQFSVTYDGTAIKYLKNGSVLRTVTTSITLPIYVDSSFLNIGGKIDNVDFNGNNFYTDSGVTVVGDTATKSGGINAAWDSSVLSPVGYSGGASVSFVPAQTTAGVIVGLNSDPYSTNAYWAIDWAIIVRGDGTMDAYKDGALLTHLGNYLAGDRLGVTYDGSTVRFTRNGATLYSAAATISAPLYADSSFSTVGGKITGLAFSGNIPIDLTSRLVATSGMTVSADTVTKTGGTNGAWDSAVRSKESYVGGAYVTFTAAQATKELMIGLNDDPEASAGQGSLNWAIYLRSNGTAALWSNGALNQELGSYVTGDTFSLTYDGTAIRAVKNGAQVGTSVTTAIGYPLFVDTSFSTSGASVTGIRFGSFTGRELVTRNVYDAANKGQLRFAISSEGRVTEYRYNSFGERTAAITYTGASYAVAGLPPDSVPTESQMATWAAAQTLTRTTRTDFAYNGRGQLQTATAYTSVNSTGAGVADGTQSVTQYVYDQAGLLLSTISPTNGTTAFTYDGLGRVLTATDTLGRVTATQYDDANAKTTVTLANSLVTTRTYDRAGRLASVLQSSPESSNLGTTSYGYDADGRLRMVTDPTGVRTYMLYDEDGRKIADIDSTGSMVETYYNNADQSTKHIAYATAVSAANLASLVDANGKPTAVVLATIRPTGTQNVTWTIYDSLGRVAKTVDELGYVTETRYDGASRVTDVIRYATAVTVSQITVLTKDYDVAATPAVSGSDRRTRYFYDEDGRVTGTLDAAGYLTENIYDSAGRRIHTIGYATQTASAQWTAGTLAQLRPAVNAAQDIHTWLIYDGQGRVTGAVDGEGFLTENVYDTNGNPTKTARYRNAALLAPGAITVTTVMSDLRPGPTPEDQVVNRTFDLLNRVTSQTDPDGTVTQTTYDVVGNVTSTTRAYGTSDVRTLTATYDRQRRLTGQLSGKGSAALAALGASPTQAQLDALWASYGERYTYDAAGRRTSCTDANGYKTLYYYDTDGRLVYTINAAGEVTEQRYNTLNQHTDSIQYGTRMAAATLATLTGGLVTTAATNAVNALANVTLDSKRSWAYNARGDMQTATDALGNADATSYNAFGEIGSFTQAIGGGQAVVMAYAYDRRGAVTQTTADGSGLNVITSAIYDAFGRMTSSVDGNGKTRSQSFDRLGRLVQTIDGTGTIRSSTYDAFGRTLTTTDGVGAITTYAYNTAQRTVTMTTQEGVTVITTRNAHGQVLSIRDGKNQTTSYAYDADGNLTGTTTPLTFSSTGYDNAGRVVISVDARGTSTSYTYDAANRVLTRSLNMGPALTTTYTYDAKGQQISVTSPGGIVTNYTFDLEGEVLTQKVNPAGLALTTTYTYDGRGKTLTVTNPNGEVTQYTYDKLGRRTKQQVDPTGLNVTTSWTYDKNSNVITSVDGNSHTTRYAYNDDNQLVYAVDPAGDVQYTEYDAEGRVTRVTRYAKTLNNFGTLPTPAAVSDIASRIVATPGSDAVDARRYDRDGRLRFTVDGTGAVVENKYDANGNVTERIAYANRITLSGWALNTDPAPTVDATRDVHVRSTYDALNRLTFQADGTGAVTGYFYDADGNITQIREYKTTVSATTPPSSVVGDLTNDRLSMFVYDRANRETYRSDATGLVTGTTYDGNNNVTSRTMYAQLKPNVSPDTVSPSTGDRITRMSYDAAGRLIYQANALNYVTGYTYDNAGQVKTQRQYYTVITSAQAPSAAVVNAADHAETYFYDKAGRHTSTQDALNQTESWTYDGLGNKLTYTNKKGSVWTYVYDAAGHMTSEISPVVDTTAVTVDGSGNLVAGAVTTAGVETRMAYDGVGNLTQRTEAYGRAEQRITQYAYDARGRQVKVTYPAVNVYNETAAVRDANSALDAAARHETTTPVAYSTQTFYDAFGNAVANIDRLGAVSFNAYDLANRVRYEVDALGNVTGYVRNTFGEAEGLTRYSLTTTLATTTPTSAAQAPSVAAISAVVNATGVDHSTDRTLTTNYDKMGRVLQVTEAAAYTAYYDPASGNDTVDTAGAKTTKNLYNSFGELLKVSQLTDRIANTWVSTNYYIDQMGRQAASVDALGNITICGFDHFGNVQWRTEYATALAAGTWSDSTYTAPTTSVDDRTATYAYDALNRRTSETRSQVTISNASDGSTVTVDLTTSYGYDAVGNLTRTTDSGGNQTYSTYDALGRVTAVLSPARSSTIDATGMVPVTEFKRDAYGNVVLRIDHAITAFSASEFKGVSTAGNPGYTAVGNAADRKTLTKYDAYGNAIQSDDAAGYHHYSSYTAAGQLAKSWQTVSGNDGVGASAYTAYAYDAVGRVVHVYTPSPAGGHSVDTAYGYNAFGEVVAKGINGGWQESFKYDNAGRLWSMNAGDGTIHVYVYDLLGRRTSEMTSAGIGRSNAQLWTASDAASAAGMVTRRTRYTYDALGRVTGTFEPDRLTVEGGVSTRNAYQWEAINSSAQASVNPFGGSVSWTGTNSLSLSWTTLGYLGSGEVWVVVDYQTASYVAQPATYDESGNLISPQVVHNPVAKSISKVYNAADAAAGATLQWGDSGADGGISSVSRVRVYKKDLDGNWQPVVDRTSQGNYGTIIEAGAPTNPSTMLTFQYKAAGAPSWTTAPMVYFGDSYRFDGSQLAAGTYSYQVTMTEADGTSTITGSGSFTTGTDATPGAQVSAWSRPAVLQTFDRWGNVASRTDPRSTLWKTLYKYNDDNLLIYQQQPDAGSGAPITTMYYDRWGNQVAVKDANNHINGKTYDSAGQVTSEIHADGGLVTYTYDAFGEKSSMVDALGNQVTDFHKTNHTTIYSYDKLARLTSVQHGTTAGGSTAVYSLDSNAAVTGGTAYNLVDSYSYDQLGHTLTQTDAAGETTSYRYDLAGNLTQTKKPLGQATNSTWDDYGHQLTQVDANGSSESWSYDYFGRLQGHTDMGGAVYSYGYDNAGALVTQTNTRGQNLGYMYDAAGQLVTVTDNAMGKVSSYAYDDAGNHLREKTVQGGYVYQDNHLAYDALGRLRDSADDAVHISMAYDQAGNRTHINTHALVAAVNNPSSENPIDSDRWYTYDAMNRQLVVDGINAAGATSAQSHVLTWDVNGNRKSDTFTGNKVVTTNNVVITGYDESGQAIYSAGTPQYSTTTGAVTESYGYDAMDRLKETTRDGVQVDLRYYDAAGRAVMTGPNGALPTGYAYALNNGLPADQAIGLESRASVFDANGQVQYLRVRKSDNNLKYDINYGASRVGYDAAGNVTSYVLINYDGTSYSTTYTNSVGKYEGYVNFAVNSSGGGNVYKAGTTSLGYDWNGYLVSSTDASQTTLNRTMVNDASGRALSVTQNGNTLRTLIVNGEMLGQVGVGPNKLQPRYVDGSANFQQVADYNFGYKSITGLYPTASVGQYTVQDGDTLAGIAASAYGNSRLWSKIAQANGLAGDANLKVGQTLFIPNALNDSNNAGTYAAYNPGAVIGDTTPGVPYSGPPIPPALLAMAHNLTPDELASFSSTSWKGASLGGLQVVGSTVVGPATMMQDGGEVVIPGQTGGFVAFDRAHENHGDLQLQYGADGQFASVQAITGGADAVNDLTEPLITVAAMIVAPYLAEYVVGPALSEAAGTTVSQATAIAVSKVGLDGISAAAMGGNPWQAMAVSAIGAGITANMPAGAFGGSTVLQSMAGNALAQGIAMTAGLQNSFNWSSVATSAVTAGMFDQSAPVGSGGVLGNGELFGNALGQGLVDQQTSSGQVSVAEPINTRVMGYSASIDDEVPNTGTAQQSGATASPVIDRRQFIETHDLPRMEDLPRPRTTISVEEAQSLAVTSGAGGPIDTLGMIDNPYVSSGLNGIEGQIGSRVGKAMIDYNLGPRSLGLAGTVASGYGVALGVATGNPVLAGVSIDQMYANAKLTVTGESSYTFLNQGLQGLGLSPSQAAIGEMFATVGAAGAPSAINAGRTVINGLGGIASDTVESIMTPYTAAGRPMTPGGLGLTYRPTSGVVLQSQEGVTTTILGSYNNDMRYVVGELGNVKSTDFGPRVGGFNVLNVPDNLYSPKTFWGQYNEPWLGNAIDRGDNFLLATKPGFDVPDVKSGISVLMRPNAITGKMELSGFGREYLMMRQNGYVYQNGVMVKKW